MTARAMAPALLMALTGCGLPANVVVLFPDENGTVGKVAVHEGGTTAELSKPLAAVNAGSESCHSAMSLQLSGLTSTASSPALLQLHRGRRSSYILYFQTGSTRTRSDGRAAILQLRSLRQKAPPMSISVLWVMPTLQDRMPITRHCP